MGRKRGLRGIWIRDYLDGAGWAKETVEFRLDLVGPICPFLFMDPVKFKPELEYYKTVNKKRRLVAKVRVSCPIESIPLVREIALSNQPRRTLEDWEKGIFEGDKTQLCLENIRLNNLNLKLQAELHDAQREFLEFIKGGEEARLAWYVGKIRALEKALADALKSKNPQPVKVEGEKKEG